MSYRVEISDGFYVLKIKDLIFYKGRVSPDYAEGPSGKGEGN